MLQSMPSNVYMHTNLCISTAFLRNRVVFFFLVYTYSHTAFLDYGGDILPRFPIRSPRKAARCKLPFALRPRPVPMKSRIAPRKDTQEMAKETHGIER